ncbi:DNA-binding protein, partial [Phocaeicola vulgatus]|nr:DNA-binding protein [Phocaeicola vulgatus]
TWWVSRADVMAGVVALEDVILEALEGGEMVRLADLGTFQIGLSGRGEDTEDTYDVSMIRIARINFRPGIALSG